MNKYFTHLFTCILLVATTKLTNAQISEGGVPYCILNNINNNVDIFELPETPLTVLKQEDIERDNQKSLPYRFGYNHYINLNLQNSGNWSILPNGDKLWQLAIHSAGATSINITFDKYKLPTGAKLFIYSADKQDVIGAFTKNNNQQDGKLGCTLVKGNTCFLEYTEPANAEFAGELQLWRITHGYRSLVNHTIKSFGQAGVCNNNVNCPIGASWQNEKRSVACIVVGGNESCTGALVDDVPHDSIPYFLTANHCIDGSESTWVFRFNWESASCANVNAPTNQTVSGSTLKAKNPDSDFALLQLSSMPPQSYNVYYSGWSRSNSPTTSAVGIHHPSGDIKKISFAPGATISTTYNSAETWQTAEWSDGLLNGATEPGSSGSPLYDAQHRIVGQLFGGPSTCNSPVGQRHDFYGKFSASWDSGTTAATRLKDWLDPQNTGALFVGGLTLLNNAGVAGITSPNTNLGCNNVFVPSVTVSNEGTNTINSLIISYTVDGGGAQTYNYNNPITSGQTVTIALNTITLSTYGNHTFTATTSMPNGNADTFINNDSQTINFTNTDASNTIALSFTEPFSYTTFPAGSAWQIKNDNNNITWTTANTNSPNSTGKCLFIDNYNLTNGDGGQLDYAITPFLNFSQSVDSLYLTFDMAFKQYQTRQDSLIVAYSTDCGNTWIRLWADGGSTLANGLSQNSAYLNPIATDWQSKSILINQLAGLPSVSLAFINNTRGGNNFYIDNINIPQNTLGINEIGANNLFSLQPNPPNNFVEIKLQNNSAYTIKIADVLGNIIYETQATKNTVINTSNFAKGLYFVDVSNANNRSVKRLVKD